MAPAGLVVAPTELLGTDGLGDPTGLTATPVEALVADVGALGLIVTAGGAPAVLIVTSDETLGGEVFC